MNQVVGQRSLPQIKFADDGNSSPDVSNWRLSARGHNLAHLTGSTTKTCTVKLARAKLPANAGNFTCSSQVKRSLAQFTCVTCSLLVNTGKFTCFEAASTSRRTHTNCLRTHINLPEYHRHFTGSFTCGTHAELPATSMQNCILLQAKIHAQSQAKKPAIPCRITCNCRQSAITSRANSPSNCR